MIFFNSKNSMHVKIVIFVFNGKIKVYKLYYTYQNLQQNNNH